MYQEDFSYPDGTYLLNHSVGRPLKTMAQNFNQTFFAPWQDSGVEPWQQWLTIMDDFRQGLAHLFHGQIDEFCPQVNLSSALTKLVMSLPLLQKGSPIILLSERDFPSMGFVLQKALPKTAILRFIPHAVDLTDANQWEAYLTHDVDMVLMTHAYSNTGQKAPLADIVPLARQQNIITVVDVAQSAGIIPINLTELAPDFLLGSSVKWLCGGSGAAYLWVHPDRIDMCEPQDVGWFSHERPFEFDIHAFDYHSSALRFWGGTPSVAPYAIAAHSLRYFANLGSEKLQAHNQHLIQLLVSALGEFVVSPKEEERRNGTAVLHFGSRQKETLTRLAHASIAVDERSLGMRVSPHIYNTEQDIQRFIESVS